MLVRVVVGAALILLCACADKEAAPVKAARAFSSAVARADVKALLELVDRGAVDRLERVAEQASNQVGGRRHIPAHEMMQIIDLDPTFQIGHAELVSLDGDVADVELQAADGSTHRLHLVREDGAWRVRIPIPNAP